MRFYTAELVTIPLVSVALIAVAWPREAEDTYSFCLPQLIVAERPAPPAKTVYVEPVFVEKQAFHRSQLSSEMPPRGHFVRGVRWTDRSGDNVAVFSQTDTMMFVAHYVRTSDGSVRTLRTITENDGECTDDNGMRFHAADMITDLDHDGVGELTFGYFHNACRTDMSPGDFKLFLLEGGDKHVLRGRAWMDQLDPPSQAPAAPSDMPAVFARHLQHYWPWLSNEMHSELPL